MDDPEDDDARHRILKRRAKFVALALAASATHGCGLIADVDYEPPPDDRGDFEATRGSGGGVNTAGSGAGPNACLGISAGSPGVVLPAGGTSAASSGGEGGENHAGAAGAAGQGGESSYAGYCLSFK